MGRDAYAHQSGLEVLAADRGYAKVRLPVAPHTLNGHGNLHGGALFTLADYTAAIASNMFGEATMAVGGTISFLSAVREGSVVAEARTVKNGRRLKFMLVEIHDDTGKLVATFQGTAVTVPKKSQRLKSENREEREIFPSP